MRLSSPSVAAAFIEGAREQGANVVDYGMIATDMMYFAVARDGHDGGVEITASHNPKQYNGIKMVRREAFPLSGDAGIGEIRDMIRNGAVPAAGGDRGSLSRQEVLKDYVDARDVLHRREGHQAVQHRARRRQRHGRTRGALALRALPRRKLTTLCFDVDGTFPNHEANPLIEENRRDIVERVVQEKADIGIAWDGDADRCFFIDGTGEFIAGDFVTALLAEAFLMKSPGATVLYDVRASYAVKDVVGKYGGKALMNKVGHSFFKRRMREEARDLRRRGDRPLLFPRQLLRRQRIHPGAPHPRADVTQGADAPPAARAAAGRSTSSRARSTPRSATCRSCRRSSRRSRRTTSMRRATPTRLDGFSAEFPEWHFNVRGSNTEPMLRLNLEATTQTLMEEKRDEVLAFIRS